MDWSVKTYIVKYYDLLFLKQTFKVYIHENIVTFFKKKKKLFKVYI